MKSIEGGGGRKVDVQQRRRQRRDYFINLARHRRRSSSTASARNPSPRHGRGGERGRGETHRTGEKVATGGGEIVVAVASELRCTAPAAAASPPKAGALGGPAVNLGRDGAGLE